MTQPFSLDVIEEEFSEDYKAWAIQAQNGEFLVIPDDRYPGRHPIRFFTSEADAKRVINAVLTAKPELKKANLKPIELPLRDSLRRIAQDPNPERADSFVVHSPNEVYEFVASLKRKWVQ